MSLAACDGSFLRCHVVVSWKSVPLAVIMKGALVPLERLAVEEYPLLQQQSRTP